MTFKPIKKKSLLLPLCLLIIFANAHLGCGSKNKSSVLPVNHKADFLRKVEASDKHPVTFKSDGKPVKGAENIVLLEYTISSTHIERRTILKVKNTRGDEVLGADIDNREKLEKLSTFLEQEAEQLECEYTIGSKFEGFYDSQMVINSERFDVFNFRNSATKVQVRLISPSDSKQEYNYLQLCKDYDTEGYFITDWQAFDIKSFDKDKIVHTNGIKVYRVDK